MLSQQANYLLEVGTEELPVSFLESSATELHDRVQDALEKNFLSHGKIEIYQTPRRLSVIIHDLSTSQSASEETVKGPPVSVALDSQGQPTPAALGFAKKMQVDFSQLERQTLEGTEYLVYHRQDTGKPVDSVLPDILPDAVLGLSGSHFMVWDESDIKFSRPIRWIVSMLGDKPLPLRIGLTHSGTLTRGHRFLAHKADISIPSVDQYKTTLWKEGHVVVDQAERRTYILQGLAQQGQQLNGNVPENEDLLDTVTLLVESPALIAGRFASDFLKLPKEVIMTVMAAHQKYFPVQNPQGDLLPYFITISNNTDPAAEESIRHGNEKVLRARLEDAKFFFEEDSKHSLESVVDALRGITFQKGLGSLYDKTQRLVQLAALLGPQMKLSGAEIEQVTRAALLSKADLATNMVRELTELQGVMGKHYALINGEDPVVADAIEAHYHPRFMGDSVATSPISIVLSLADKLDTLVAVFSQKNARLPSGSKDPMGLRRMTLGILQTVLENKPVGLDLNEAFKAAYANLGGMAQISESDTLKQTTAFLIQRFKGYLLDQQFSYDTIDSVLESDVSPLSDLNGTLGRLTLLKALQQNELDFKLIYEPANRTARILGSAYAPLVRLDQVNPALFEDPAEGELFKALEQHTIAGKPLETYLSVYKQWSPFVEAFFNKVLVNADNAQTKQNRYRLLSVLNASYRQFADFTKLVV